MSDAIEKNYRSIVKNSFEKCFELPAENIKIIPPSGSDRYYFRVKSLDKYYIGCFYNNLREKEAFVSFTKHFHSRGLNVPEFLHEDDEAPVYFIEDLGGDTFGDHVFNRTTKRLGTDLIKQYEKILSELIRFQIEGYVGLDLSVAYPRPEFDKRSILWDLNYFKYYFLKIHMDFDEEFIENDFNSLTYYLLGVDSDYFLYRDFQSRNIIIRDEEPFFIDYQGGRRGPLQYDLASILYQAKAKIPIEQRDKLYNFYISKLKEYKEVDEDKFRQEFKAFVLVRTLQVLGAYGFRGMIQQKDHFLESIPTGLENLKWCLQNWPEDGKWPYLYNTLAALLYKARS